MCSIAGIITFHSDITSSDRIEVNSLLEAMKHRGPDAADMRQPGSKILLGSNRLGITDTHNPAANMPLRTADGRFTLVFNGEIYNHQAIRKALPQYPFTTASDSETLLAAYGAWGQDALPCLEGMFAFAIYDQQKESTLFAVDPTGQKTVYLHGLQEKNKLVFASEIEALVQDSALDKHWDTHALQEYISQRFIVGDQTHIKEIKKLEPGTSLEVFANGTSQQKRFYRIPIGDQSRNYMPQIKHDIRTAVEESCDRTSDLEVKGALLLSGGIDSTAVLAQLHKNNLQPQTFSIGFKASSAGNNDPQFKTQDCDYAATLAQDYGTEHFTQRIDIDEYCQALDKWTDYCGEPLGSQEAPCLIRLLEAVQSHDCRVVFTGSGADELFDGYSYGAKMELQTKDIHALPAYYVNAFHWTGNIDLHRLIPDQTWHSNLINKYHAMLDLYQDKKLSTLQAVQLMHFHGRLAVYECRQMDVISMRHSVEARAPLLDLSCVETAFNFNPQLKQLNGIEKGIFKESVRGLVPDVIVDRKKGAFPIMQSIWSSPTFEKNAQILFESGAEITKNKLVDRTYLREIWDSKAPDTRNIFSRLYTLEKIMRRQAPHISPPDVNQE